MGLIKDLIKKQGFYTTMIYMHKRLEDFTDMLEEMASLIQEDGMQLIDELELKEL